MNRISRRTPAPSAGIVHLGLGVFSRAHIALYTEDAIASDGGHWGIIGASLRSPVIRDALAVQQFTYTAAQLGVQHTTTRHVEVITDVLVAPENAKALLEHMAHPAIKIVSLTITEKGYCLAPSSGAVDLQHPHIIHDLVNPIPVSAPGFIVRALEARMLAGLAPFTVLSCDNLPQNGKVIRQAVLTLAEQISTDLLHWIKEHARFPSTMVDRITPATTLDDLRTIEKLTGFSDAAPVVHEAFSQWVIEDEFVNSDRPNWGCVGADIVKDVRPYELMKLRMLNGTHSALAYLGYLAGFETIAETVANDDFMTFTQLLWKKEIMPSLSAPQGVSLTDYASDLMARYSNPKVRHQTWQIAMDGSQKLPQRFLETINERLIAGADTPGLILAIAAWVRYVSGTDELGGSIDVRDPLANHFARLAETSSEPEEFVAGILATREVFPPEMASALHTPVLKAYQQLLQNGAHDTVRSIVTAYGVY